MELAGGEAYRRAIRPALPSADRKFLLKLLQLEIAAHPPQAEVLSLALTAEAGQSSQMQLGLFAPQMPEPSRLDVTIARLKAIAGEERVGSPALEDTHRPGSFRMESFRRGNRGGHNRARMNAAGLNPSAHGSAAHEAACAGSCGAARLQPVAFREGERCFRIAAAYGPWRASGCWWSADGWNVEEWDVLTETNDGSTVAWLLVSERGRKQWQLEAFYD